MPSSPWSQLLSPLVCASTIGALVAFAVAGMTIQSPLAEAITRWCVTLAAAVLLLRSGYWLGYENDSGVWTRAAFAFFVFGAIGAGWIGMLHLNVKVHSQEKYEEPGNEDDPAAEAGQDPDATATGDGDWVSCGALDVKASIGVQAVVSGKERPMIVNLEARSALDGKTTFSWYVDDIQVWREQPSRDYKQTSQHVNRIDLFGITLGSGECTRPHPLVRVLETGQFRVAEKETRSEHGKCAVLVSAEVKRKKVSAARIEFEWSPTSGIKQASITPLDT